MDETFPVSHEAALANEPSDILARHHAHGWTVGSLALALRNRSFRDPERQIRALIAARIPWNTRLVVAAARNAALLRELAQDPEAMPVLRAAFSEAMRNLHTVGTPYVYRSHWYGAQEIHWLRFILVAIEAKLPTVPVNADREGDLPRRIFADYGDPLVHLEALSSARAVDEAGSLGVSLWMRLAQDPALLDTAVARFGAAIGATALELLAGYLLASRGLAPLPPMYAEWTSATHPALRAPTGAGRWKDFATPTLIECSVRNALNAGLLSGLDTGTITRLRETLAVAADSPSQPATPTDQGWRQPLLDRRAMLDWPVLPSVPLRALPEPVVADGVYVAASRQLSPSFALERLDALFLREVLRFEAVRYFSAASMDDFATVGEPKPNEQTDTRRHHVEPGTLARLRGEFAARGAVADHELMLRPLLARLPRGSILARRIIRRWLWGEEVAFWRALPPFLEHWLDQSFLEGLVFDTVYDPDEQGFEVLLALQEQYGPRIGPSEVTGRLLQRLASSATKEHRGLAMRFLPEFLA